MTKQQLGKYLWDALDLSDWRMDARAPGNIVFTRAISSGSDILYFQPKRGVYSLTFGQSLSGARSYSAVVSVLRQAGLVLPKYLDDSFHVGSRQVRELYFAEISSPADFEPWLPTARAMVHEDVLPELERYRYLGPLHERIAAEPLDRWSSFVSNPPHPHVAIIKYLVGAPDWNDFLREAVASYREHSTGKHASAFLPHIPVLESLLEILPSVNPLSSEEIWGPRIS